MIGGPPKPGGHPAGPQPAPQRGGAAAIHSTKHMGTSNRNSASLRITRNPPGDAAPNMSRVGPRAVTGVPADVAHPADRPEVSGKRAGT